MAKTTYEHILKNGNKVQVDSAIRDGEGRKITSTYATKTEVTTGLGAKVDKTTTIAGIDLQDNITKSELLTALNVTDGANKVEASTTNGNIKINGTETTVYNDTTLSGRVTVVEGKVTTLEGKVATIEDDYLTSTDKTELEGKITTEKTRAMGQEAAIRSEFAAADTTLDNKITAETTRATGVESGLDTRIQNLEARGRFLSSWNVGTGLPSDYPEIAKGGEYPYKSGDYYIVGTVPASGDKYQPDGDKITRDSEGAYSVPKKAETREVGVGDYYIYTKTGWVWIQNSQKTVNFSEIAGAARDNINLKGELEKVDAIYLNDGVNPASGLLVTEATTRANADTTLQTNIDNEATARSTADTTLGNRIKVYEDNKADYDDAVAKAHTHSNKTVLDGIKAENLLDDESGSGNAKKSKLAAIEAGAQVNVQSDWNQTDNTKDDFIKNKPTINGLLTGTNNNNLTVGSASITVSHGTKPSIYFGDGTTGTPVISYDDSSLIHNLQINSDGTLTLVATNEVKLSTAITSSSDTLAVANKGYVDSVATNLPRIVSAAKSGVTVTLTDQNSTTLSFNASDFTSTQVEITEVD